MTNMERELRSWEVFMSSHHQQQIFFPKEVTCQLLCGWLLEEARRAMGSVLSLQSNESGVG